MLTNDQSRALTPGTWREWLMRGRFVLGSVGSVLVLLVTTHRELVAYPAPVRAVAIALACASIAFLAALPGLAALAVAAHRSEPGPAAAATLLLGGSCLAGLCDFWLWLWAPAAGQAFAGLTLIASVLAVTAWLEPGTLSRLGLTWPLSTALLLALAYTALAFWQGGLYTIPTRTVDLRFWIAPDNVIPRIFADRLAEGGSVRSMLIGEWHTSDRPPLQTGIALLQYPLLGNRDLGYQLLGTIAQVSWVVALWALLRARGFGHSRILAVVMIVAATGFTFFSSIYVWPKLLAASLCLCALANLVSRHRGDRRPIAVAYAGVAVALAMLAHGGIAFSVLALVPFGIGQLQPRFRRALLLGGALALGVYLPWVLYQHYVDPPGDRLIKWHLAGVIPVDPRSAPRAILDQYTSVSASQFLSNKMDNVRSLIARPGTWRINRANPGWRDGFAGFARIAQLNNLMCAAGPLLLASVAALVPSARTRLGTLRPLWAFVVFSLVAWVLLEWGAEDSTTIIQSGPYAPFLLLLALLALAILALPTIAMSVIVAISVGWFFFTWLPLPGFRPSSTVLPAHAATDWAMPMMLLVALAGFGWLGAALRRSERIATN
jgi:hypothetical protein